MVYPAAVTVIAIGRRGRHAGQGHPGLREDVQGLRRRAARADADGHRHLALSCRRTSCYLIIGRRSPVFALKRWTTAPSKGRAVLGRAVPEVADLRVAAAEGRGRALLAHARDHALVGRADPRRARDRRAHRRQRGRRARDPDRTKASIAEGKTIAEPLQGSKVFPGMVVQMIAVGEQTGAMDAMLSKIADFYDDEVDTAVDALTSLLEPLLMVGPGRRDRRAARRDVPADLQDRRKRRSSPMLARGAPRGHSRERVRHAARSRSPRSSTLAVLAQLRGGGVYASASSTALYALVLAGFLLALAYGVLAAWSRFRYLHLLELTGDALLISGFVYCSGGARSIFGFLFVIWIVYAALHARLARGDARLRARGDRVLRGRLGPGRGLVPAVRRRGRRAELARGRSSSVGLALGRLPARVALLARRLAARGPGRPATSCRSWARSTAASSRTCPSGLLTVDPRRERSPRSTGGRADHGLRGRTRWSGARSWSSFPTLGASIDAREPRSARIQVAVPRPRRPHPTPGHVALRGCATRRARQEGAIVIFQDLTRWSRWRSSCAAASGSARSVSSPPAWRTRSATRSPRCRARSSCSSADLPHDGPPLASRSRRSCSARPRG